MRARSVAASAVLLAALTLTGCSVGSGGSTSDAGMAAPGSVESLPEGGTVVDGDAATRQVVSTGTVSITAEDPLEAATEAVRLVEKAGGRIDSRVLNPGDESSDTSYEQPSATLVVRIPAAALSSTLDDLYALGEVQQVELSESDVTAQASDLDARITALQTSADRLTALLATAGTTKDLLDIETTLSQRQSDLDALSSQKAALAEQVALASVSLSFGSEESAPADTPSTFASGFVTGFEALVSFGSVLLVAAGIVLPWLVVLAVIGGIVLVVLRRRRARSPRPPAAATTMET